MPQTKLALDELLARVIKMLPDSAIWVILVAAGITVTALILVVIVRVRGGDEITLFKVVILRPNQQNQMLKGKLEDLGKEFHSLYARHETKRVLLQASQDVLTDMIAFLKQDLKLRSEVFVRQYFDIILNALLKVVEDSATNPHRVGLFAPDAERLGSLRLYQICSRGFTLVHAQTQRLPIERTAAGWTYRTGNVYCNLHLSKNRDGVYRLREEGTYPYESLLCVPVKVGSQIIGVLSVDAQNPDAFTDEHRFYVEHCAALLATLFTHISLSAVHELLVLSKRGDS